MDIKQQILDEIEIKVKASYDREVGETLAYPLTACVSYRAGLLAAEQILIKELKGMVIAPAEPTSVMIGSGEFMDDTGKTDVCAIYEAMIGECK